MMKHYYLSVANTMTYIIGIYVSFLVSNGGVLAAHHMSFTKETGFTLIPRTFTPK